MKLKFFFKDIFIYQNNAFEKRLFVQQTRPTHISIRMNLSDYNKYNEKYTYSQLVVKDKFKQMLLDKKGMLTKTQQKMAFNNTSQDYKNLISICKRDENFKDMYKKFGSYIDAIYLYDAEAHSNKTEQMDPINDDLYQAIDNTAICFKHIDYTLNKKSGMF